MTIEFLWRAPTRGDGRYADARRRLRGERDRRESPPFGPGITDPRGARFNYFDHLHQIARASELSTFEGLVVEHDPQGDESWIVSGYLARATRTARIVTEFEASWGSPVYAAKNAVSFQRYSGARAAWHLKVGAPAQERRRHADPVPDADVVARIDEFLTVARGVITRAPYSYSGRFFTVQDGGFRGTLSNHAVPRIYLDGDDDERIALSAKHADVHVLDAAAVDVVARRAARIAVLAAERAGERGDRPLVPGLRLDLIARESDREAEADALRAAEQLGTAPTRLDELTWTGWDPSYTRASAVLVGSYERIAERLVSYVDAGVRSFQLGAVPHLEEAYRVGAHVLPRFRTRLAAAARAA